ncbi:Rieske (2Fe-2S) protein [Ichthyenterobacterium magnum]|uniref:Nitrite reductase/ring-hydroxylating ferredoxin subunit n=1 Tax=Ichthyenterobacterium magnum TaxID=1230530 RepID=A0A420DWD7_9FLAO|nr:hypothetical protein [Ichthyenterobacterium magnum]RKE98534.1 hypothetical protein BXY80_0623 [Ichthyenterobacterium magnum]
MKRFLLGFSLIILTACSSDNSVNNCNFLLDLNVNASLNLSLPQYAPLLVTSGVYFEPSQGNKGIYIINTGNDTYRAWDATDPNHVVSSCSFLQRDGVNVTCGCDDQNEYSLFTGQNFGDPLPCGLFEYRATLSGNTVVVSN